jgi:hypothetical protein
MVSIVRYTCTRYCTIECTRVTQGGVANAYLVYVLLFSRVVGARTESESDRR